MEAKAEDGDGDVPEERETSPIQVLEEPAGDAKAEDGDGDVPEERETSPVKVLEEAAGEAKAEDGDGDVPEEQETSPIQVLEEPAGDAEDGDGDVPEERETSPVKVLEEAAGEAKAEDGDGDVPEEQETSPIQVLEEPAGDAEDGDGDVPEERETSPVKVLEEAAGEAKAEDGDGDVPEEREVLEEPAGDAKAEDGDGDVPEERETSPVKVLEEAAGEAKAEDGDVPEERETSPIQVLEEPAGEAPQSVYHDNTNNLPLMHWPGPASGSGPGHRRSQSETLASHYKPLDSHYKRNNSFQRWRGQMQKALRLGTGSHVENCSLPFNPEILADQKRQWYQLNSKTWDHKGYEDPISLFDHFIVAGLHPDVNIEPSEDTSARKKKKESNNTQFDKVDSEMLQKRGPSFPSTDPQILFKYPPRKRLPMRMHDLAAFCFPSGVKAHLLQRTESLSELNELVHGQEHLRRDDLSFVFSLKVADNATLYGVCLHVQEIVQRPLAIYGASTPLFQDSENRFNFLVAAPRCYCVLTRVPFFELHYEVLNSITAQERLNRITQFVNELALAADLPSTVKQNGDSSHNESAGDLMALAIPVDCAMVITAAAAGINLTDEEVSLSSSRRESLSLESCTVSQGSDYSRARAREKDTRKLVNHFDDTPKASGNQSDFGEMMHRNYEDGQTQFDGTSMFRRNQTLEHLGSSGALLSSVRSITSEDDDDLLFANDMDVGDERIMEWAEETKNDLLQIVSSYHSMPLPPRGSQMVFEPLEHLQAIEYRRLPVSALMVSEKLLDPQVQNLKENPEVNLRLAVAEEAAALSIWTTATICRVLSLENIMALVTGVLLEKQVMVVSPNLGVLTAVVLSLIPIIRPFQWQSLFLPILPEKMFDFLDAPVPYIVGIQHKPDKLKINASNLLHVNLVKDQVKTCCLPLLPRHKELLSLLRPIHTRLSSEYSIAQRHPVYKCNIVQAEAAGQFLAKMREYLESLCSNIRLHAITSVQSDDRVSVLLKDSFIDSFHSKDQPFAKMFVDTQIFSVLSDCRLSSYEDEHYV